MRVLTKSRDNATSSVKTLLETAPFILNAGVVPLAPNPSVGTGLRPIVGGLARRRRTGINNPDDLASFCKHVIRTRHFRVDWLTHVEKYITGLRECSVRHDMSMRFKEFKKGLLHVPKIQRYIVPQNMSIELITYPKTNLIYPILSQPKCLNTSLTLKSNKLPTTTWTASAAVLPSWSSSSRSQWSSEGGSEFRDASKRMLEQATNFHFSAVGRPDLKLEVYRPNSGEFFNSLAFMLGKVQMKIDNMTGEDSSITEACQVLVNALIALKSDLKLLLDKQNYLARISQDRTRNYGLEEPLIDFCKDYSHALTIFVRDFDRSLKSADEVDDSLDGSGAGSPTTSTSDGIAPQAGTKDLYDRALSKVEILKGHLLCIKLALENCERKRLDVSHVISMMLDRKNLSKANFFQEYYKVDRDTKYRRQFEQLGDKIDQQEFQNLDEFRHIGQFDALELAVLSAEVQATPAQLIDELKYLTEDAYTDQLRFIDYIKPQPSSQQDHPLYHIRQGCLGVWNETIQEAERILKEFAPKSVENNDPEQEAKLNELVIPVIKKMADYKALTAQIVENEFDDFRRYTEFFIDAIRYNSKRNHISSDGVSEGETGLVSCAGGNAGDLMTFTATDHTATDQVATDQVDPLLSSPSDVTDDPLDIWTQNSVISSLILLVEDIRDCFEHKRDYALVCESLNLLQKLTSTNKKGLSFLRANVEINDIESTGRELYNDILDFLKFIVSDTQAEGSAAGLSKMDLREQIIDTKSLLIDVIRPKKGSTLKDEMDNLCQMSHHPEKIIKEILNKQINWTDPQAITQVESVMKFWAEKHSSESLKFLLSSLHHCKSIGLKYQKFPHLKKVKIATARHIQACKSLMELIKNYPSIAQKPPRKNFKRDVPSTTETTRDDTTTTHKNGGGITTTTTTTTTTLLREDHHETTSAGGMTSSYETDVYDAYERLRSLDIEMDCFCFISECLKDDNLINEIYSNDHLQFMESKTWDWILKQCDDFVESLSRVSEDLETYKELDQDYLHTISKLRAELLRTEHDPEINDIKNYVKSIIRSFEAKYSSLSVQDADHHTLQKMFATVIADSSLIFGFRGAYNQCRESGNSIMSTEAHPRKEESNQMADQVAAAFEHVKDSIDATAHDAVDLDVGSSWGLSDSTRSSLSSLPESLICLKDDREQRLLSLMTGLARHMMKRLKSISGSSGRASPEGACSADEKASPTGSHSSLSDKNSWERKFFLSECSRIFEEEDTPVGVKLQQAVILWSLIDKKTFTETEENVPLNSATLAMRSLHNSFSAMDIVSDHQTIQEGCYTLLYLINQFSEEDDYEGIILKENIHDLIKPDASIIG